jgi:hypothetical protein
MITVTINVDNVVHSLDNLRNTISSNVLLDEVGKIGLKIVQDLLEPLSRSGATRDSFSYSTGGNVVTISSQSDSAYYIGTGFADVPSTTRLQSWMALKPEFAGLSDKESRRVAFAIQYTIKHKIASGANSTISKLQPVGERKYDYIKLATEQLTKQVESLIRNKLAAI